MSLNFWDLKWELFHVPVISGQVSAAELDICVYSVSVTLSTPLIKKQSSR